MELKQYKLVIKALHYSWWCGWFVWQRGLSRNSILGSADCEISTGTSLAALVFENCCVVNFGASMIPAGLPYRSGVCASASNARLVSNFKVSCPSEISGFLLRRCEWWSRSKASIRELLSFITPCCFKRPSTISKIWNHERNFVHQNKKIFIQLQTLTRNESAKSEILKDRLPRH